MITIWLDKYLTPSLNKSLRTHWAKRKREQKILEKYIWYYYVKVVRTPFFDPPEGKIKVKVISYRKSLLDDDNFTGGLKGLIDSLKNLRFIYDDSPKYMELEAVQVFSRDKKGTEIQITSL